MGTTYCYGKGSVYHQETLPHNPMLENDSRSPAYISLFLTTYCNIARITGNWIGCTAKRLTQRLEIRDESVEP